MIQLEIYGEDGTVTTGTTYDRDMVSIVDSCRAIETWQVGTVKDELAVRLKTISSLNALLRRSTDGDRMLVSYRPQFGRGEIKETLVVCQAGYGIQPMLMSSGQPALTDAKIVRHLGMSRGELITVTYKLMSNHEARLERIQPHELSAYEKVLVGGTMGA